MQCVECKMRHSVSKGVGYRNPSPSAGGALKLEAQDSGFRIQAWEG